MFFSLLLQEFVYGPTIETMLKNFRERIGKFYFRKEQARKTRTCKITNLEVARRIGILYSLDDVPDYDRVSELVTQLQHQQKEVKALGFVKNKALVQRFLPKLSFDFFSQRDLNWFYKPIHSQVKDFIEKEFDLLIDINLEEAFPLQYIAGLSNALCRVGKFSEKSTDYYDVMIDIKPVATPDDFIVHVRHYLTMINSNENRP